jgi:hypothetical protein
MYRNNFAFPQISFLFTFDPRPDLAPNVHDSLRVCRFDFLRRARRQEIYTDSKLFRTLAANYCFTFDRHFRKTSHKVLILTIDKRLYRLNVW